MSPVIRVENLGKKYLLRHQQQGPRYKTLRDVLTGKAKGLFGNSKSKIQNSKSVEEFWALKDVNFEIKQGEAVGIIGRNGAGKSTLLKLLSRITQPTTGRMELEGRVASLLEVGTGFHPELTGRENIYLNGAILGMGRAEIKSKFDEIVAFAEVEKFLDTPVKRYSSGMYMRLAFAVAANLEPEILIVDEVLAVGDAAFQKKCLGKMGDVTKGGVTVIFVSHNMAAINTLTTQCLFLAGGQLKFHGSTAEAIKLYSTTGQNNDREYHDENPLRENHPRIKSVKLFTSLPDNVHVCEESFQCEIVIETLEKITNACLSVQIFDADQSNHVHFWIHDTETPFCREPGTHILRCEIPRFRLYMGSYRLRVFFTEPPGGRTFQAVDGICPFDVIMPNNHRLFQWWPKEAAYIESFDWKTDFIH